MELGTQQRNKELPSELRRGSFTTRSPQGCLIRHRWEPNRFGGYDDFIELSCPREEKAPS